MKNFILVLVVLSSIVACSKKEADVADVAVATVGDSDMEVTDGDATGLSVEVTADSAVVAPSDVTMAADVSVVGG